MSIGTYVSSDEDFRTSSYWIDGKDGVVVIDTQFLLSAAEEVIAHTERVTGKKVVLAIVLCIPTRQVQRRGGVQPARHSRDQTATASR